MNLKSDLAAKLRDVLENMSQEEFDKEWSQITALNLESPSFSEAIEYFALMQAEREHIKKSISPVFFKILEESYKNFTEWYNDSSITDKEKNAILKSMLLTATPSIVHPQYIRLEMIEYWKERFSEYPDVVRKLNEIR